MVVRDRLALLLPDVNVRGGSMTSTYWTVVAVSEETQLMMRFLVPPASLSTIWVALNNR